MNGRYDHVQVHTDRGRRRPINDALAVAGVQRRVALKVETFLSALHATVLKRAPKGGL